MKLEGFTPGPWHVAAILGNRIVGDETTPTNFDKLQIHNANATVATVYRARDARLIALAPELAEALNAAVSYLEDDSRSPRRREACLSDFRALLARLNS